MECDEDLMGPSCKYCLTFCSFKIQLHTVFHAKGVECEIFHLLVNISGILHARPTYDISLRSPIFGDHFDTNNKVSHDSHVTQLAEEVTRFLTYFRHIISTGLKLLLQYHTLGWHVFEPNKNWRACTVSAQGIQTLIFEVPVC